MAASQLSPVGSTIPKQGPAAPSPGEPGGTRWGRWGTAWLQRLQAQAWGGAALPSFPPRQPCVFLTPEGASAIWMVSRGRRVGGLQSTWERNRDHGARRGRAAWPGWGWESPLPETPWAAWWEAGHGHTEAVRARKEGAAREGVSSPSAEADVGTCASGKVWNSTSKFYA